jgi:hypothetical protein
MTGGSADTGFCCWNCVSCEENEFLKNETTCETCPKGYWPDEEQTSNFLNNLCQSTIQKRSTEDISKF